MSPRASRFLDLDGTAVRALLGPTNTGKTHRALQRMLEHRSGMIGLPLRLLAREVYDRLRAERGEQVALITGEEKRVPPGARYFVCTVEAMPLDVPVDFLCVDEVQLCAHATRGHVFTDRLLRARGLRETWFLGSDAVRPLLEALVPSVTVDGSPRLSTLTYAGPRKLASLPKRSAAVAFSVEQVYTLAERLQSRAGGVAVVLGALSPKTRNAQVAMFQSGEVPYLVATDAIGMGLNLDLDHVAFTAIEKFDGRGRRALTAAELGQIAGRAGRWRKDGTFGSTTELGPLDSRLVDAIEAHDFPPVQRAWYRNAALDLASPGALLDSLAAPPPHARLLKMKDADDQVALAHLAARDGVVTRARGERAVGLLWEVCQVPDFRKTLTDSHHDLLERVFTFLVDDGVLPERWVAGRIARLDAVDADIDALTTRLAYLRTWSYLTHRRGWIADAPAWQARVAAIEERVSDALHQALLRRFVSRRHRLFGPRAGAGRGGAELDEAGVVRVGGERVGRVDGFTFHVDPAVSYDKDLHKRVRLVAADVIRARVATLDGALTLGAQAQVLWRGQSVASLERGDALWSPRIRPPRLDLLAPDERERVRQRLDAWLRDALAELSSPLRDEGLERAGRALVHALGRGLGEAPRREVAREVAALTRSEREVLTARGVYLGDEVVAVTSLRRVEATRWRATLWSLWHGVAPVPALPEGAVSVAPVRGASRAFYAAIGYRRLGPRVVRTDVLEAVGGTLARLAREGPFRPPNAVRAQLGCTHAELPALLTALGYRDLGDGRFVDPKRAPAAHRASNLPAGW